MMSDSNTTNLTIIVILCIVLFGVGGYLTFHHFVLKSDVNDKGVDSEKIEEYESYKIGDFVTLRDNSTWNLISESTQIDSDVNLLRSEQLEDLIDYKKAEDYVMNTFASKFAKSLNIGTDEVSARLLSIEDIRNITGIGNLEPGVSMEDSNQAFLYRSSTMTDEVVEDTLILICESTSNELAKICMGTGTNTWKIRPVISISKKYIKYKYTKK